MSAPVRSRAADDDVRLSACDRHGRTLSACRSRAHVFDVGVAALPCYAGLVVADDIPGFFEQYGWRFEQREPGIFRTGFVGDAGAWDIWVRATSTLVLFVISPLVPRPTENPPGPALLRTLLKANHELNLAKLAIDDDNDISLSVELAADGFGYSHFSDALTALAHYADEYKERFDDAVRDDAVDAEPRGPT
jgi:hypothetical protein